MEPATPASPASPQRQEDGKVSSVITASTHRRNSPQSPAPSSPLTGSLSAQELAVKIDAELNPAKRIQELEAENKRLKEELARERKQVETCLAFIEAPDFIVNTQTALQANADERVRRVRGVITTRLARLSEPSFSPKSLENELKADLELSGSFETLIKETKEGLKKTTETVNDRLKLLTELKDANGAIGKLLGSLEMEAKRWKLLYYTPIAIVRFEAEIATLNLKLAPFCENPRSCSYDQLTQFKTELGKVNKHLHELLAPERNNDPVATHCSLSKFFSFGQDKHYQEPLSEDFKKDWNKASKPFLELFVKAYVETKKAEREIDIITKELDIGKRLQDLQKIHVEIRPRLRNIKSVFKTDGNQANLLVKAQGEFALYRNLIDNWVVTITAYEERIKEIDTNDKNTSIPEEWKKEIKVLPKAIREDFRPSITKLLEDKKSRFIDHRKNLVESHTEFYGLYLWFTATKVQWLVACGMYGRYGFWSFYAARKVWGPLGYEGYLEAERIYNAGLAKLNGYVPPPPTQDPDWNKAEDKKDEVNPQAKPPALEAKPAPKAPFAREGQ